MNRPPARLTLLTASLPATVTKTFKLVDERLERSTAAEVCRGQVEQVALDSLAEFAQLLTGLDHNQCLLYGIPPLERMELVTERAWVSSGRPPHQIARTKSNFSWPDGPGVLMLDYDPPADRDALTCEALVEQVRSACPGLRDVAMLWWPSASSCIVNSETRETLRDVRGQRLYLLVQRAADIPRAGKALCELLWADGHGTYMVSTSGTLLERAVFDASVWQTNRIDFASGAVCMPPLTQERSEPVIIPGNIGCVDTATAIPDPDADHLMKAARSKAARREALSAVAEVTRARWSSARIADLASAIATREQLDASTAKTRATETVERATQCDLSADWSIVVQPNGGDGARALTVAELLDDPYRWHGCLTKDPLEPEYDGGRWVGKLYLLGTRQNLYSFAHGGQTFRLTRQSHRIELVAGRLPETVDALVGVLRRSADVFEFGTDIVIPTGEGKLQLLDKDNVRYWAGRLARFWRWKKGFGGERLAVLADPPIDVCNAVLALKNSRSLKRLDAIISAPLVRPNGTVLQTPGYDPDTQLLLDVSEPLAPIPSNPNHEELREALRQLWEPFNEFPFVTSTDRGVLLAALLTAVQRPVLPTAPAFAIDAPKQGTGKSLIADCLSILATGERSAAWPHIPNDESEIRKRLMTVLRSGARVMLWDNVVGTFNSESIASLLTSPTYTDRVLNLSESECYPNRLLCLFTGNNFTPSGELPRRVLSVRIDAQCEKPHGRSFRLAPASYCMSRRQDMIAAALTLMRGFVNAGSPNASTTRLGSFETWDSQIRQAVLWIASHVAEPGFLADPMDAILETSDADPADELLFALMTAWRELFGDKRVTARELLDAYRRSETAFGPCDDSAQRLAEALDELLAGRTPNATSLGKFLGYRRDRLIGGRQIRRSRHSNRNGVWLWHVEELQSKSAGDVGGAGLHLTPLDMEETN